SDRTDTEGTEAEKGCGKGGCGKPVRGKGQRPTNLCNGQTNKNVRLVSGLAIWVQSSIPSYISLASVRHQAAPGEGSGPRRAGAGRGRGVPCSVTALVPEPCRATGCRPPFPADRPALPAHPRARRSARRAVREYPPFEPDTVPGRPGAGGPPDER